MRNYRGIGFWTRTMKVVFWQLSTRMDESAASGLSSHTPAGAVFDGASDAEGGQSANDITPGVDTRPVAIAEGEQRSPVIMKGLRSPIKTLRKKFRSSRSRGPSLMDMDIAVQALSGVDGAGEYVLTPVGSDANHTSRHYGDGDVSASDAVDDAASEDSGESMEDGGGGGSDDDEGGVDEGQVEAGQGGTGYGTEGNNRKAKRAIKLKRGLSNVARRLKKRSMGASEALTLGRISLAGESGNNSSYVRAHDVDEKSATSFAGGWGKGMSSPESGTRRMPKEWNLPLSSAGSPTTREQGKAPNSSSGSNGSSRQASPTLSEGVTVASLHSHSQMRRGITDPCTYSSCVTYRPSQGVGTKDVSVYKAGSGSSPLPEDVLEQGQRRSVAKEGLRGHEEDGGAQEEPGVMSRGRSGAAAEDRCKSKSLSPKAADDRGRVRSVERRRQKSRSASPSRLSAINPFGRKPPSPVGSSASATPGSINVEKPQVSQYCEGGEGHGRVESTSSLGNHALMSPGSSVTPPPGAEVSTGATSAIEVAKSDIGRMCNEESMCHNVNNDGVSANVDESEAQSPEVEVKDVAVPAMVQKSGCSVPSAPPSELKYGDRLRLWARRAGRSDATVGMAAPRGGGRPDAGVIPAEGTRVTGGAGSGGYVGSREKVQRVSKKLFKRNELAMIGQAEGSNASGFTDCHFKAVDPENKRKHGDVVRYGDVVLLVDDRDYVWSDNAQLLPGSLRMKSRGSKRQIAVSFRPFLPVKVKANDEPPAVVFGTEGLEIVTVDNNNKDLSSRKRRYSSRKRFHALTAFSKKNSRNSSIAGAYLCSDGRGQRIVFEVHLPNASPAGDPSPVVTKVTIHVEERPPHHERGRGSRNSDLPALFSGLDESLYSSEAPTAPLSCVTAEGSNNAAGGVAEVGITEGRAASRASDKRRTRPKSVVSKTLNVARLSFDPKLRSAHKRRSSMSHKRRSSLGRTPSQSSKGPTEAGVVDSRMTRSSVGPYSLSAGGSECSSPATSRFSGQDADGDEDTIFGDDGGMSGGEMGAFEGLKWGEHVQFKMPGEGEVLPDDPVLTLRLSNGYSATLISKQLRENAGLGKFPIKATRIKGSQELIGDIPCGNGAVYLRCTLTPIECSDGHHSGTAATTSTRLVERETGGLRKQFLPSFPRDLLPMPSADKSSLLRDADAIAGKSTISGSFWFWVVGCAAILLVLAAALPAIWTTQSRFTWPSSSSSATSPFSRSLLSPTTTTSTHKAPPSDSPSPCTSVWDIRRPDGTAYPHNQLSAAAAALEEETATPADSRRLGRPDREVWKSVSHRAGENEGIPPGERVEGGSRPVYPGSGLAAAETPRVAEVAAPVATIPLAKTHDAGVGVRVGVRGGADGGLSPDKEIGSGQWHGRGEFGGGGVLGFRAVVGAIGVAAVAVVMVLLKGLFGLGSSSPSSTPSSPAPPLQAQVHLLSWDGRRLSEAARATEDIDSLYYPPPSGSTLEPLPHRFLVAESMDAAKAWARWEITLQWRKDINADSILNKPHPKFALIKSKYAHCFHLPDKGGRVTYYERPGMSDIGELKKLGITKADLLEHYVYCMEYLWQVLQPRQSQRITIIIDLAGVKIRDLVGESLTFLKTSVGMMSRHYPQRSFKIMILNAPSFFNSVFAMVKPMLNEATKKKIDLLPVANVGQEMLKVIPSGHLPLHYGGTGEAALGESPAELAMLAHVQKVLEEKGEPMQTAP